MDVDSVLKQHKQLLAEFAGTTPRDVTDTFWNQLLSFTTPLMRLPPSELEAATTSYCEQLGEPVQDFSCQNDELHQFGNTFLLLWLEVSIDSPCQQVLCDCSAKQ